jgi:hypothetical protein
MIQGADLMPNRACIFRYIHAMSIVLAIFTSTNLQVGGIRAKGPIGHTLRTF